MKPLESRPALIQFLEFRVDETDTLINDVILDLKESLVDLCIVKANVNDLGDEKYKKALDTLLTTISFTIDNLSEIEEENRM
ncbi:MAG: hypothetical protein EOM76_02625 [Sphingobacteriia bacterium]|jgi:hypothetical protein|nr:hypothetical protein [Paludibacteraceae bacterium]NCA79072.1 hypothetical protein [Sphingobacteriia bacterium]